MMINQKSQQTRALTLALFLGKAFIFSCVFWLSWIFIFREIVASQNRNSVLSSQYTTESNQYEEQLRESARQLEIGAVQQARLNKILELQERNAQRHAALLETWEKEAKRKVSDMGKGN